MRRAGSVRFKETPKPKGLSSVGASTYILIKCKKKTIGKLSYHVSGFVPSGKFKWLISFSICDNSKGSETSNFKNIELPLSFDTLEEAKSYLADHNVELFDKYEFYDIDNMTSLEESIKIK